MRCAGASEAPVLVEAAAAPAQAASTAPQTAHVTSSTVLSSGSDRAVQAQQRLVELADRWGLPRSRALRWLAAAGPVLEGRQPLEMFVQYDRVTQLLTLELWAYGKVVFGIDDWLGV